MKKIRLTREFNFEMAHCLEGYDGSCRQIHGHSYRLFITVLGTPITDISNPKCGMVMDFGELKAIVGRLIVSRYDHALVMRRTPDDASLVAAMRQKWQNIILTPYQPTCENMILDFVDTLHEALPRNVELIKVEMYETEKSSAQWRREDNV